MEKVASELSAWMRANGLDPAQFRLRIEARTIAAQRDLIARFDAEHPPGEPHVPRGKKPVMSEIEVSVEGPLPHFR